MIYINVAYALFCFSYFANSDLLYSDFNDTTGLQVCLSFEKVTSMRGYKNHKQNLAWYNGMFCDCSKKKNTKGSITQKVREKKVKKKIIKK